MKGRRLEAMLWVLALLVLVLGWQRWRRAEPDADAPPSALQATPPEPRAVPRARLAAAGRAVVGGNPFRLDRAPAPIGFNQPGAMMPGMPAPYVPPPPPRPQLAVTGIVGPPWQAVMEGIPGREGTSVVVRRGDVFGDLRIRDVTRTTVVVSAPDTTWRLTVRRWQ
ncbi:hypothetical protein [Longimicrobium sp.]|uniref:hypothetical protein n=1 Tax=Longimicrobium sp. TaxID=2029185 RepID=UPI002E34B2BD|nr:hypothetical protein [Longimicrobium sp.]HEX6042293.1 hypothetical protein [Longimicrobium sp.]